MQDFKHLTRKRRFSFSALTGRRKDPPRNSFKRLESKGLEESKPRKKSLRVLLPVLAALIAAYPVFSSVLSGRTAVSSDQKEAQSAGKLPRDLDIYSSFRLGAGLFPQARLEGDRLVAPVPEGGRVVFAIDSTIQERVREVLTQFDVPYGVFVAIEPKSGKVLAMVSHSSVSPEWEERAFYGVYPMASLFKIITATAALEQGKVTPDTVIPFRGGLYSESARYWSSLPKRGAQEMDLTTAMGKSVNPVFGRVACDIAGRESVLRCAERYGFNHYLLPGTPVQPSRAEYPRTDNDLRLMGAGLGREVKISPIHVAVMMAAIANGGTMLAPSLVEEIRNTGNKVTYTHQPRTIRSIAAPEVTAQLTRMLSTTVTSGTSRRAFHDNHGRPRIANVNIAAKTGSINGTDPEGHYNWFAAYAPVENPQIALAALVINQDKWKIKASYLGEQALEAFFAKGR
ncbi:penicillin-binding protein transpeptidase [Geobacter metallireducens RCH3]|uniref:Transpeptidase n=1 Tax=Geobacter metallireducens (strain ATCC 53774 / DSM 7210 / GS-15) TaxID=269799 RepID=Q39RX8_GEOMG|nr:penicillin-binding transpeptidase domain-containing protein [Geobacter metallireducens]ABB32996.1 transpeptidase [Geobacter metallireducens GS-15]EHP88870.1 penicillin-binding protein transpeptidase [Geobacter metallireducens RCH3]